MAIKVDAILIPIFKIKSVNIWRIMLKHAIKDHYAVIGWPMSYSLSPYIHQSFAKAMGENMSYQTIESEPNNFANSLREFLYYGRGLNITAPFKELVIKTADEISPAAEWAQAANILIKRDDHSILADNTDGIGFIRELANQNWDVKNKTLLIIGAGGAARGILAPLIAKNPKQIVIVNRSFDKAKSLAHHFTVDALSLSALKNQCFDLIIRASSMLPELPPDFSAQNAFCLDLNYGERAVDFRRWAKQQSTRYCDGLGMLVEQAAESFYLWRGVRPDTNELIAELRKSALMA